MKREIIKIGMPKLLDIPVSRGARFGNILFTQGMTSRDPVTGKMVEGDMYVLSCSALNSIKAVVEAGGSSLDNVLQVTCILEDINRDYEAWNKAYLEFFPTEWPTRFTFQAVLLYPLRIEVSAVAGIP